MYQSFDTDLYIVFMVITSKATLSIMLPYIHCGSERNSGAIWLIV